ncbi:MAG: hypothetical protein FWF38_04020 [Spirochaetaceae bacterium]|nr:hypothetical protein [Spirochaetaceae bacterium]
MPGGHGESASVTENRGSGSKSGATSSTGSTSTSGSTSSIGSTSTSGSTSSTGSTGSTSSTGSTGSAGTTGVTGTTSSTGASDASSGRDGTAAHGKNQNGISSSTDASFGKQSQADNGSSQNSIFTYLDNSNISSSDFNNSTEEKGPSIVTGSASDNTKKSKNNILLISIIIIILLIIIIFLMIIRYYSRSSVKESYNIVRNDIDIKDVDKEGNNSDNINRRPIIMKVANQNDQIVGTSRNIHPFKSGAVKSVGGGNSSYLIFLYKIPGTIASLKFDGEKYIFTPLRPEFFPENGDKEIENPLEKNIKIKTEKQHILSIKFWEYISPLEKINSIMHLTEHRGVPLH